MSGTSVDGIDIACADLRLRGDELTGRLPGAGERAVRRRTASADSRGAAAGARQEPGRSARCTPCWAGRTGPRSPGARRARGRPGRPGRPARADRLSLGRRAGAALGTLQLGSPAEVAEALGIPVISDLRSRDIAAGGQGAPLVPMFDWLLLSGPAGPAPGPAGAVNLGGIANLTVVADGQVVAAYDVGPAGALMDPAARRASGGALRIRRRRRARRQRPVRGDLLRALAADPFFALAAAAQHGPRALQRRVPGRRAPPDRAGTRLRRTSSPRSPGCSSTSSPRRRPSSACAS